MPPSHPCRFAAYLPHCCNLARAANDRVGTLASLPTPLDGCPLVDQCQCMVMNVDEEPDEPATNVIPIARGRRR